MWVSLEMVADEPLVSSMSVFSLSCVRNPLLLVPGVGYMFLGEFRVHPLYEERPRAGVHGGFLSSRDSGGWRRNADRYTE